MPKFKFDQAYYDKFYGNQRTRVASRDSIRQLGDFVASYLRHFDIPIHRVLDIGCGLGYWKRVLQRHFPKSSYVGVEYSQYLCDLYGWTQGSVVDFKASEPFDLVICQGVLQYLSKEEARRAIRNLASLCRGALYLEVLTVKDWEENCDQSVTDGDTYLREGSWYRDKLRPHFLAAGGGLFIARAAPVVMYELEGPEEIAT